MAAINVAKRLLLRRPRALSSCAPSQTSSSILSQWIPTQSLSMSTGSTGPPVENLMNPKIFHDLADTTLLSLQDHLEGKLDIDESEREVDINYSQGVLTVKIGVNESGCVSSPGNYGGSGGTWVLNKQEPNREIWWSSPISGPKRFAYFSTNQDLDNNIQQDDHDDDEEEWSSGNAGENWVMSKGDGEKMTLRDIVEKEF